MKTLFVAVLIALGATSFAATGTPAAVANSAAPWVLATVKKIDKANAQVVLAHAALPNGMPGMTMAFKVKQSAWLDQMAPGQKIRFSIPADGAMVVDRFETIK